ncbi:MAG TPA: sulfotransferase domain-containing protein [Rhizomicrobium sp.]|nr:sulfotransferase domain-containing protein [Rhizomicrobium sp.]
MTPRLLRAPARTVHSRVYDSRVWERWQPRSDDIIIGTYAKCGTTWMQRIVCMLVFQSAEPKPLHEVSPWFEMRPGPPLDLRFETAEAQTHRRFLKTHLPHDALPIHEGVKFIHVARDGRDSALSFHNHLFNFSRARKEEFDAISLADPKFRDRHPPTPEDPADYFHEWLRSDGDGQGDAGAGFFHVENSYWAARNDPDMLMVHYADLKADREGEMRRIAHFLGITIPESVWPSLVEAAGFDEMRRDAKAFAPGMDRSFAKGTDTFFNKGTNGRWRGVFRADDLAAYDARVKREFAPELARWLERGRLGAGS